MTSFDTQQRAGDLLGEANLTPEELRHLLIAASAPSTDAAITRTLARYSIAAGVLDWERLVALLEQRQATRATAR